MQIKLGQSQDLSVSSGTLGGLLITAYLQHATANTPFVPADFTPQNVQVSITLNRAGRVVTLMNANLLLLGSYFMRKNNFTSFINGESLINPAGGTDAVLLRSAWLRFDSSITLNRGDVLTANVQLLNGAFTANVDAAISYLDFSFQPSTVRETGVPMTVFEVVNQNATQQQFVNASAVRRIEFLNFDKTNWVNPVVTSGNILSDRLNYAASLVQLIASENYKWPANQPYQFGATQFAPTVVRNLNMYPQMLTLYEAAGGGVLLNNCVASLNFDSAQVAASQNWVGNTQMLPSI